MTADAFMSAVAIIYIHTRFYGLKFLSCVSMSDITLLSKFLFSVEPCHSLLPNANLIIVHFFHARPSMFKHLSSNLKMAIVYSVTFSAKITVVN